MESKKAQDSEPWKSPIPREVMTFWGEWSSDDFRTFRRNTYLSVVGYKFETLSTIPKPWGETSRDYIEGRELEPTNNKEQYCSVVRTGIGKTILCIGGEVDASEQPGRHHSMPPVITAIVLTNPILQRVSSLGLEAINAWPNQLGRT